MVTAALRESSRAAPAGRAPAREGGLFFIFPLVPIRLPVANPSIAVCGAVDRLLVSTAVTVCVVRQERVAAGTLCVVQPAIAATVPAGGRLMFVVRLVGRRLLLDAEQ